MFHRGAKANVVAIIVSGNCSGFPDFTKVNWISVSLECSLLALYGDTSVRILLKIILSRPL